MTSKELATHIAEASLDKKGQNVTMLNVTGLSSATDFFVIISAESQIQLKAIADHIERKMRTDFQEHIYHKEGSDSPNWILLDYVDVVVHIFRTEVREHYAFERLWADAEQTVILDEEDE